MSDLDKAAQPAPRTTRHGIASYRRALAQRALACELTGELERAAALIRCLQHLGRDADPLAAGEAPRPV